MLILFSTIILITSLLFSSSAFAQHTWVSISADGGKTWEDPTNKQFTIWKTPQIIFKLSPGVDFYGPNRKLFNLLLSVDGNVVFNQGTKTSPVIEGQWTMNTAEYGIGSHNFLFKPTYYIDGSLPDFGDGLIIIMTLLGPVTDSTAPSNPTISSLSHKTSKWNEDNTIDINWSGASDDLSGVDGFSYSWSKKLKDVPDDTKDAEESQSSTVSPSLSNTNNWYFHLKTRDNFSNWSTPIHLGPFYIGQNPVSKLIFKAVAKVVKLGKSAILKGQLKDGNGRPLAGKKIVIKANGKVIKKVKTNSKGVFKLKIKPSKTTVFTALFTGDSWFKATSTRQAKVVVKEDI